MICIDWKIANLYSTTVLHDSFRQAHNFITTKAVGLIFYVASSWDVLFANYSSFKACIMVLITFVLLYTPFFSLLLCRWQFAVHVLWLQCETWVSAVLAGDDSYVILCLECYASIQRAQKWNEAYNDTPWSSNTPTFKVITGACTLMIETSVFSYDGWIDCGDVFHAVFHL